jgi:hypothetical protein
MFVNGNCGLCSRHNGSRWTLSGRRFTQSAIDFSLAQMRSEILANVEESLERLADGSYGLWGRLWCRNRRGAPNVDLVLNMDGFGSQNLKRDTYRTIFRQGPLDFAGIKLFYRQDTNLFGPAAVMAMSPRPSVVIYQ